MNDYNITELTLEFVKKLRDYRRPSIILDPSKGVPSHALKWLLEKLKINNGVIYIYQSTGRSAIKKKLTGIKSIWKNLNEELLNYHNEENNRLLLKLDYLIKSRKGKKVSIGFLGLQRKESFTESEVKALKEISLFISDYMYEIIQINRSNFHDRAIERINIICQRNNSPGTIIQNLQGTIHRAIRAYASYFIILNNNKLIVEYYQKPTWNRPRFDTIFPEFEPFSAFSNLYLEHNFFHWVDLNPVNSLKKFFKKYVDLEDEEWEYLIGVSKVHNDPIGLWVFQFNKQQLIFNDLSKNLIQTGIKSGKKQVNYLFQRRTNKMIVDPIFKSRNTKIEEDKVFILMPFTEAWSDRIWKKLIQPIIIEEGFEPVRADDLYGRDIVEDIWSGIVKSRFVIADITNRNPNVFYELGIAHTLGKDVILLTQDSSDIPFDLNRYRHIIYQDNFDGYEMLVSKLKGTIRDIVRK